MRSCLLCPLTTRTTTATATTTVTAMVLIMRLFMMRRVVPTVYGFVPPPMRVYPTAFPSQMSSTMTIRRMSQTIETATSIGSTSEGDDGSVNVDSGKDADASDDGRKERSVMNENESSSDTDDATDNQQSPQPENQRNLEIKKARSVLPVLPDPSEFPDWAYEPRSFFRFEILHESSKSRARVGRIHTPHGIIDTPGFVAVATNAALKGVDFRDADKAGQQLIFANTYHLLLQPGSETIREAGGIHKYTGRTDRPFITDSGGFQVFSLAYGSVQEELSSKGEKKTSSSAGKHDNAGKPDQPKGELKRAGGPRVKARWRNDVMGENAVKVSENGVTFRSYRDGSKFLLTPESTVLAQKDIGADIIIPLDELPPYHIDRDLLSESVDRSHRWEARSLKQHLEDVREQAMYCVVHGGIDREFRTRSVDYLTSLPFDGYAIGGSLGNGREELKELLSWMMPMFDSKSRKEKPKHLLGIADEESIRNGATMGIDTFDSCYPTRLGRHGTLLTRKGPIRIKSGKYQKAFGEKIDEECQCSTCQQYDRAYLWHLFKANEPIAVTLAAIHNIQYMTDLMASIRQDIMEDKI